MLTFLKTLEMFVKKNYGLDPAWYYTAPGLAWDAALKVTKVKLELLADPDMLLMIEKGIRGGVSMISTCYGKANNPYTSEAYDSNQPTKYISYLDVNNLYGWATCKPLPTHGLEWIGQDELNNWKKLSDSEGTGCILEVDFEYPKELHDLHNDYPLAPEILKRSIRLRNLFLIFITNLIILFTMSHSKTL